jgi:hypothetical protein
MRCAAVLLLVLLLKILHSFRLPLAHSPSQSANACTTSGFLTLTQPLGSFVFDSHRGVALMAAATASSTLAALVLQLRL